MYAVKLVNLFCMQVVNVENIYNFAMLNQIGYIASSVFFMILHILVFRV